MAKAVIMLAMLKQVLNSPKMEKDCKSFDEKDNIKAGTRARRVLLKLQKMSKHMRRDILEKDIYLKVSRGRKRYIEDPMYKERIIENQRLRDAKKTKTKKL